MKQDCKLAPTDLKRYSQDARLYEPFAGFESLVQSDLITYQSFLAFVVKLLGLTWIVVQQTTCLPIRPLSMFSDENRVPIKVADGKMIWASGRGYSCYIDELSPAQYVPFLSISLISVSRL